MPAVQYQVGQGTGIPTQNAPAGLIVQPAGQFGEEFMAQLHGKYYALARSGCVFVGSTAVGGVTIPATNATAMTFGIWNPSGSGKNAVMISSSWGFISGTGVADVLTYSYLANTGSSIGATDGPVKAFTGSTPLNAIVGGGLGSVVRFTASAATLAAGAAVYRYTPFSHGAPAAATASVWPIQTEYFDGTVIIPPGVVFFPSAAVASEGVTYGITWVWAELPV